MTTLNKLIGQYSGIVDAIYKDIEEGSNNQENLLEAFKDLELSVAEKIDSYAYVADRLKDEAEYWALRSKQASSVSKACKNALEQLKFTIKSTMDFMDTEEVCGIEKRFKLANCAPKLIIEDESILPDKFKTQVVSYDIDTAYIKRSLIEHPDIKIPGAFLEHNKSIRSYANKPKVIKKSKKKVEKK